MLNENFSALTGPDHGFPGFGVKSFSGGIVLVDFAFRPAPPRLVPKETPTDATGTTTHPFCAIRWSASSSALAQDRLRFSTVGRDGRTKRI